ncbi:hypothetical protein WA538_005884 [Blastocystis sp. DL]
MSEIVVLQFGNKANEVGAHFWNLQNEHYLWGQRNSNAVQLSDTTLMMETQNGAFLPRCIIWDDTAGFGEINPQTGTKSPSVIKEDPQPSYSPYGMDYPKTQRVDRISNMIPDHWSHFYNYRFSTRSIQEVYNSHSVINPIDSVVQCHEAFQNQSQMESLQERIRWQFEQCDSISGVVLLEDLSRGWDMIQTVTEYISEEDVRTVFTLGMQDRSHVSPFDESLSTLHAIQSSSLFSSSNSSPVATACCLDSVLTFCRQQDHRRRTLRELAQQFVLQRTRSLVDLRYAPEAEVDSERKLTIHWRPVWERRTEASATEETSRMVSVVSRLQGWDLNRAIYGMNTRFVSNATYSSLIVSDPLLLPMSSVEQLRRESADLASRLQWYSRASNSMSPTKTHGFV